MSDEIDIKTLIKERDEILLSGDIDRMIEFHAKHNPHLPRMTDRATAEAAMHKARTAVTTLPMEIRSASKAWLKERNYGSLDDGDVP